MPQLPPAQKQTPQQQYPGQPINPYAADAGALDNVYGVGRQLIDALLSTLQARGIKAVHLMVRPENAPARALYESLDFRAVPRQLMTKRLSPVW